MRAHTCAHTHTCCRPLTRLRADRAQEFAGANVVFGDVTSLESLRQTAFSQPVDVVVSCLASRTGGKKDSWDIDYQVCVCASVCVCGKIHVSSKHVRQRCVPAVCMFSVWACVCVCAVCVFVWAVCRGGVGLCCGRVSCDT